MTDERWINGKIVFTVHTTTRETAMVRLSEGASPNEIDCDVFLDENNSEIFWDWRMRQGGIRE